MGENKFKINSDFAARKHDVIPFYYTFKTQKVVAMEQLLDISNVNLFALMSWQQKWFQKSG